jgi:recombination DNA repair RAD52 pathway protein
MRKWSEIIPELRESLNVDRVKTRVQGKQQVPYLEGDDVINRANEIFEHDGWSAYPVNDVKRTDVGTRTKEGEEVVTGFYTAIFICEFHGLLENGTVHTIKHGDVGKNSFHSESLNEHEMAASGCATDALKRSMRQLGNQFGIELYNKDSDVFKQAVGKTKAKPKPKPVAKPEAAKSTEAAKTTNTTTTTAMDRAREYTVPATVVINGNNYQPLFIGKALGYLADANDIMSDSNLAWLAGERNTPAGVPPFTPEKSDPNYKMHMAAKYLWEQVVKDRVLAREKTMST